MPLPPEIYYKPQTMFGEIIAALVSTGFVTIGIHLLQKGNHLVQNGKKAKAIVFKNNCESSKNGKIYYPVVRFLTYKQEWITQELSTGSNPAIPEGTSVEVIYDPDEPNNVEINSDFRLKVVPILLLVIGFAGLIVVILELFDITQLID
jgi:hypothetical protein